MKVGVSTLIILNDPRAVYELIHKKGSCFVDRPTDEQWDLATHNENIALMHFGPEWRAIRKVIVQTFSAKNLDGKLVEVQEAEWVTSKSLDRLPKAIVDELQNMSINGRTPRTP